MKGSPWGPECNIFGKGSPSTAGKDVVTPPEGPTQNTESRQWKSNDRAVGSSECCRGLVLDINIVRSVRNSTRVRVSIAARAVAKPFMSEQHNRVAFLCLLVCFGSGTLRSKKCHKRSSCSKFWTMRHACPALRVKCTAKRATATRIWGAIRK